jgi:hypothetical protein
VADAWVELVEALLDFEEESLDDVDDELATLVEIGAGHFFNEVIFDGFFRGGDASGDFFHRRFATDEMDYSLVIFDLNGQTQDPLASERIDVYGKASLPIGWGHHLAHHPFVRLLNRRREVKLP